MNLAGKDRSVYVVAFILVAYTIMFSGVGIWRHYHFLHERSGDLLIFEQVVYNTAHGNFFYNNFSAQSHFGDHNSAMLAIMVPFSYLFPTPYVLYTFTVLSISISAIPIYLIAAEYLGSKLMALFLMAGYLMLPGLVGQVYMSFHEINLVLPFLTFAFYFFLKEKFYPFVAMMMLGMLVKEDVALTMFMFAPYALIKKRSCRWYLTPVILSVSWFLLSIKLVIPHFNTRNQYGVGLGYFSSFGATIPEIISTIVRTPMQTLAVMWSRANYLYVLLLPFCFVLPFISTEIMFSIPSILFNLLADSGRFRLHGFGVGSTEYVFPMHMSIMASALLYIALIMAIKNSAALLPQRGKEITVALVICTLAFTCGADRFLVVKHLYKQYDDLQYVPTVEAVNNALSRIPLDATVVSDRGISTHLYDRKESYYDFGDIKKADYVVITTPDVPAVNANPDFNGKFEPVYLEQNVGLFKRKR
ncbi:MAG TPA: DUF2079 domain-containing protein [Geomonas sp.]|nr:DUF2079 domain-containing protein [Geomonas sp.]